MDSVTMDELLSISGPSVSLLVKLKRLDTMIADVPYHFKIQSVYDLWKAFNLHLRTPAS